MKTLTQLNEDLKISRHTKVKDPTVSSFVFEVSVIHDQIRVFSKLWTPFKEFKNNVFIDGEHVELDDDGYTTREYNRGEYQIDIKGTNEIVDCEDMFFQCKYLTKVLSFNHAPDMKNMRAMFKFCNNLQYVELFDTDSVETMEETFYRCENLKSIPKFNTENVGNMKSMFKKCLRLETVPELKTQNVRDFTKMFEECVSLSEQTKQIWSKKYKFQK